MEFPGFFLLLLIMLIPCLSMLRMRAYITQLRAMNNRLLRDFSPSIHADQHSSPIARLLANEACSRSARRPADLESGRPVVLSLGRDHERWMQTEANDLPVVLIVGNSDGAMLRTIAEVLNGSGLFTAGWTPDLHLSPKNFDIYGVPSRFLVTNNLDAFDIVIVDPQVHAWYESFWCAADVFFRFRSHGALLVGLLHALEDRERLQKEGAQHFIGTGDLILTPKESSLKLQAAYMSHRQRSSVDRGN